MLVIHREENHHLLARQLHGLPPGLHRFNVSVPRLPASPHAPSRLEMAADQDSSTAVNLFEETHMRIS